MSNTGKDSRQVVIKKVASTSDLLVSMRRTGLNLVRTFNDGSIRLAPLIRFRK